jgi:hypothetical protein
VAILESAYADRSYQCCDHRYSNDGVRSKDEFRTI